MLVILIPAAWFAIMAFTVILCRCAARADALAAAVPTAPSDAPIEPDAAGFGRDALVVFEARPAVRTRGDARLRARRPRTSATPRPAPSVRGRGERCAAALPPR